MAKADSKASPSLAKKTSDKVAQGAMAGVLQELFQDMYARRWQLYKMNFVRGLFFGVGGALGGTVIIFLLAWSLSFFDTLPVIGNFVDAVKRSLESSPK